MDFNKLNLQAGITNTTTDMAASEEYINTTSFYDQLRKILSPIIDSKLSVVILICSLSIPLVYELLGPYIIQREQYLETTHHYYVFGNYITAFLQHTFGTTNSIVGILVAFLYSFQIVVMSAFAYFIFIVYLFCRQKQYRRREPWVYLAITLVMFSINILAFVFIPTAPPIRTTSSLGYRITLFPSTESIITIKYNSFPFGHIWSVTVPYLASRAEGMVNTSRAFEASTILTSWIILMTGDHYFIDVIGSFVFSVVLFIIFTSIYDYYHKRKDSPKTRGIVVDKRGVIKRLVSLLILSIMGIATLYYINSLFFVIQLVIIFVLWPVIAFKNNFAQSIYTFPYLKRRDFPTDLKDFFSQIYELISIILSTVSPYYKERFFQNK